MLRAVGAPVGDRDRRRTGARQRRGHSGGGAAGADHDDSSATDGHASGERAEEAVAVRVVPDDAAARSENDGVHRCRALRRRRELVDERQGGLLQRHGQVETAHAQCLGVAKRGGEVLRSDAIAEVQIRKARGGEGGVLHRR